MNLVDRARQLAIAAHHGDTNQHDGEPYLLHLDRVFCLIRDEGGSTVEQAIAWLHDSYEDGKISLQTIRVALGDDIEADMVVAGVDAISKRKGETLEDYYHRCKANANARFVKLRGDMVDNFSRNHKITDEATKLRMASKYSLGMSILK